MPKIPWELVSAEKRSRRDDFLDDYRPSRPTPSPESYSDISSKTRRLSEKGNEITDIDDVEQLVEKLRQGTYTAVEVVRAYIRRCAYLENDRFGEVGEWDPTKLRLIRAPLVDVVP